MIGNLDIKVIEELPKIGDRFDYRVQIVGPGETDYKKQASITRTLVSVWDLDNDAKRRDAVEKLVSSIIKIIGTASEPPGEGFWFDTFNTGDTLDTTIKEIPNKPLTFIKGLTVRDEMALYIGDEIISLLEKINEKYEKKTGEKFYKSLDHAFVRSQAVEDMNNPPNDRANFLYRICILSVILDRLNFTQYDNRRRSLVGFSIWLEQNYGQQFASETTEPLFKLKILRRQYPLHEHYEEIEGKLQTRLDLVEAERYFDVQNTNFAGDWHKVSQKYKQAFESILQKLK